jgi:hypothetical protein
MLVGQKIGPFVVDKELGSGAMGSVYRGRHMESGRKVAIKLISMGLASNMGALGRFKRETSILKQLDHPNIVKFIASGKVHGTPFYVMEYVEGESLDHVMERRGRLSWEELIPWGQQLCAALQHAHEKGIIHRDLKPSNLMVLKGGIIKLTDFGIAKDMDVTALTAANSTVGTAAYMSPEQCRGSRDITAKSDLYSMGVMFFELLTGRKPFLADTVMEMFMQHTKGTFPRPTRLVMEMPIWLDNLICQLLEKDPEKRPFNAEAVSQSLGMVKEKWENQQSAALTAAKKRRADRTDNDVALDETDKEAARTLLGKKKKTKKVPFHQKNWFTFSAVGAIMAALLAVVYVAFIKAPPAEWLYAQAERLMKSDKIEDRREAARRPDGPLAEFLYYHPDHPKVGQIRSWIDQVDLENLELQMHNRRNRNMEPDEKEAEPTARLALDAEEVGKLQEAVKHWESLLKLKNSEDQNMRPWSLVAAKHMAELKDVDDLFKELKSKIYIEGQLKRPTVTESPAEKMALEAVRAEVQKDWKIAQLTWEDLKTHARQQDDRRRWLLLASYRLRELVVMDKGK